MNDSNLAAAAAAGRLVVTLLFAANAAAYLHAGSSWAVAGMVAAIISAALGYFAASAVAFGDNGAKLLNNSIAASVAAGIFFLLGG